MENICPPTPRTQNCLICVLTATLAGPTIRALNRRYARSGHGRRIECRIVTVADCPNVANNHTHDGMIMRSANARNSAEEVERTEAEPRQTDLICIAIGSSSPIAKTVHNGYARDSCVQVDYIR